ncbi:hypothetical protein FisN_19Hh301 [Fistulifera solaris]|uniref:Cyclopropane-fatty-acyl-phospholipid synthase n=1 Tax=Fistulifera solaris TaxID=1519565 RepID=A0A1Z5K097_FISSO|nr:hypothetical protein FisN_19Hh301 [Fistulifera solaris]|eukprot:GAX19714.1 hypothetical protein FisN_19Hh301 [Fistulifera solaris]
MSLQFAQTIGLVRNKYDNVKLHHWVILYAAGRLLTSTRFYQSLTKRILSQLSALTESFIPLIHMGLIPDFVIRWGIRLQLRDHLHILQGISCQDDMTTKMKIIQQLRQQPIAIETTAANEQHYEVPAAFYDLCLGPCKKYSSGYWPTPQTTFEESELHMLELYCQRAELQDGMKIVDLGCGWGSLTLFLAAKYPNAKITSISNSHSQREYILSTAAARGLNVQNIQVITCNVADDQGALQVVRDNDRVMTIEMLEHMKNYQSLLQKVQGFLKPGGKLFVHIFTHKDYAYHFEQGWMSDNFFTGGTMPSDDLLLYFAGTASLGIQEHWRVNGQHYEKTSNGWLRMLDQNWRNGKLGPVLQEAYGVGKEREWYVNWRLFFLACAELWGYDQGEEWIVSHYLFVKN